MPLTDPALQRRKLRDRLRRLRESAGYTQRDVATEMEWSLSKLIRIESGRIGISITDLRALIAHYGVTDQTEADRLIAMARAARVRPWWDPYRDIADPAFLLSLGYEGAASIIRTFEPMLVPGLLQTWTPPCPGSHWSARRNPRPATPPTHVRLCLLIAVVAAASIATLYVA